MRIFYRNSRSAKSGDAASAPGIAAIVAVLLVAPAAWHALAPASLVVLQIFLDVCQSCLSFLRICGA